MGKSERGPLLLALLIVLVPTGWATNSRAAGPDAPEPELDLGRELQRGQVTIATSDVVAWARRHRGERLARQAVSQRAKARRDAARLRYLPVLEAAIGYTRLNPIDVARAPVPLDLQRTIVARQAAGRPAGPLAELGFQSFDVLEHRMQATAQVSFSPTDALLVAHPSAASNELRNAADHWRLQSRDRLIALRAREVLYSYVRARGKLLIERASLVAARQRVDELSALVRAGLRDRGDLLASQARVAAIEVRMARSETQKQTAAARLSELVGRVLPNDIGIKEDVMRSPSEIEIPTQQTGLPRLPELRELIAYADALRASARAADGARWPKLSLVVRAFVQNPDSRRFPPEDSFAPGWSAGVAVEWSPNAAAQSDYDADSWRAAALAAESDAATLQSAIRARIAEAIATYRGGLRSFEAAQRSLDVASNAYRAQHALFIAGKANSSELHVAEDELRVARQAHLDAALDVRIAAARLMYAIGEEP